MTAGLRQSIKTKNKLYKKFVKKPITYGNAYREFRNNLTKLIKTAKNIYHKNKFNNVQGDIKRTWKCINTLLGKAHKQQSIALKIDSIVTTDAQTICNTFNDYFSTIATKVTTELPQSDVNFDYYLRNGTDQRIVWDPVTMPEMKRIISKCNNTKPGPDKIPMKVIKDNIDILTPVLTHLCNLSLSKGIFPDVHKIGKIIPLYKGKDKYDKSNYRPICLLNAIGKMLEKVAATRIINYLESNNLLAENQFAYRKGKGTDLANVNFIKEVLNAFDENKFTLSVFLDLTKAFDCVSHTILLEKLKFYGIRGKAHDWIAKYLSNRANYVSYGGKTSEQKINPIGVPQGSILGPLLFLIYINDLNQAINSGNLSLFADDANFYKSSDNCFELIRDVNRDVRKLSKWFIANRLSLNNIKTEAMVFSRKTIYFPLPPVVISDIPIPYSFIFKFLGLILDFKLKWRDHRNNVQSKLSSACGIMFQIRNKVSKNIAKLIYYSIAFPYLNYCSIVWSSAHSTFLQSLFCTQKKLIRLIMKKERRTPSSNLFNQLKVLKICDIFNIYALSFVYKSINNLIVSPINFLERAPGVYNLRARPPLQVPRHTSQQSERFIHIRGARLWNEIPDNIKSSRSIISFNLKLKKQYLDSYVPN